MDKKEFGRAVLTKAEQGLSLAVGCGTAIVTTTICMAFMPQQAPRAFEMAFRAGTYGLSGVTGSVAATLTREELDEAEDFVKDKAVKTKRFINKHGKKNKVKVEIVE